MKKIFSFIRWKFVIPVTLVVAGIFVFFIIFLDPLLARGIEMAASKINGAKVDVSGLHTKLFQGRLTIAHLQVTDRDDFMKNMVEAGPLSFQILPSELISKRFIIPEGGLEGLRFNTDRQVSGELPKRLGKEAAKEEKPGVVAKLTDKYKDQFKLNLDGLKDQAKAKVEFNPKDLELTKQSDNLKAKAEGLPNTWKVKVDQLNMNNRLKKVEEELKEIEKTPTSGTEALTAIPASLKKLQAAKSELDQIKKDLQNAKNNLNHELDEVKNGVTDLQGAKEKDFTNLMSRFNLDFADPQKLVENFVGPSLLGRVQTALHYVAMARKYMPSKKEEKMPEKPRAHGADIQFPTPAALPRFWLKNAHLSGVFQDVTASGSVAHLTSSPARVGQPATANLSGYQGAHEFAAKLIFDHVTEISKDSLSVQAKNIQLKEIISEGVLGSALSQGSGQVDFGINAVGEDKIKGNIDLNMSKLRFDRKVLLQQIGIDPAQSQLSKEDQLKSKFMQNVAQAIEKMPSVSISGRLAGTWENPGLSLSSNLTAVLGSAIKDSLGDALKDQKKELQAKLDAIFNERKSELNGKVAGLQSQLSGLFGGFDQKIQEKVNKASGLNLSAEKGKSPVPGVKIPSLDKLFKK